VIPDETRNSARLDDHDKQLANIALTLYGSDAMHLFGLVDRLAKIESVLEKVVTWQRDVQLTLRVGTALLGATAVFGGLQAWPELRKLFAILAGG
jgi:hypothetical protein